MALMVLFWTLSFAIAWALTLPAALAQLGVIEHSLIPYGLTMLIGLAPIIAATVAAARARQGRSYCGSLAQLPRPGWIAVLAAMLPPLVLAIAYAVHWALGRPIRVVFDTEVAVMGLVWLLLAFGEEAGWRGFALPRLVERHGFWLGSSLLGIIWCVWHYPRLLGSPYLGSLSETLPLIGLFSVQIIISNFILCWLYFRSGRSVIAPTLFHASFNVVATAYFLAATDVIVTGLLILAVSAIAMLDRDFQRVQQGPDRAAP